MLGLDNIYDQLHAITENLQVLSAEVRSKLQDNVVVLVEGRIVVDRSLRNTDLSDLPHIDDITNICGNLVQASARLWHMCKKLVGQPRFLPSL